MESEGVRENFHRRSGPNVELGIRSLAECLGEGLLVVQDHRVVFMDERLLDILGTGRNEMANDALSTLLSADSAASSPGEIKLRRSDGRWVFLRSRSGEIEWEGRPATVHFMEDITLRKNTEKQLTEQKEVSSILANTVRRILASPLSLDEIAATVLDSAISLIGSRIGVLIVEDSGKRILLEQRCTGSCGVCSIPRVLEKLDKNSAWTNRRQPGRIEGAYYINETLPFAADCKVVPFIDNLLKVPARNDSPVSAQIVLAEKDEPFVPWDLESMEKIAEVLNLALVRRQAVYELQQAKEAAEREAEARSLFLANVGHEIRAPLNGVLLMSSMLQESQLEGDQKELLDVVMFSARTIDRLIRDLTDLTQIGTGKFTFFPEEFDLDELFRTIVEMNRPEALRKGLDLDYSVPAQNHRFYGDRERIGQIVGNLMTNAVKYTEQGQVRLTALNRDGELELTVTDTGIGIPPEYHETVFELFNQGNLSRRRGGRAASTGIGLAVVKDLTEVMGGTVRLAGRPGGGSCFTVTIPSTGAFSDGDERVWKKDDADLSHPATILVVEDEGINRLYLRTLIEREGWNVDEAADGVEAVSLAKSHRYDLILMDINMPRMDGLEATKLIRRIRPKIPIVAITANAYEDDRAEMLECGLDDVVHKPLDDGVLKKRIRYYLSTG